MYNHKYLIIVYRFEKCNQKAVIGVEMIPESVREVLRSLQDRGYEAWCVGGAVRDRLLGREPGDWDVTTSALPEETMAVFGDRAIPTGIKHGTITVRTDRGPVETTTFRVDGDYRDHRRPEEVTFTRSLEEDLKRRDFAVNAMALGLTGELRDPFGGQADLKAGILRCVGEPDRRFQEDALRILRGLRFAATLGFTLDPETGAAIRRNRELLGEIAAERIWAEVSRLLCGPRAAAVLRAYPEVFGVFWPELLPMVGFDHRNFHHIYDVWEHTLHALEAVPGDLILRLTMLFHDIGKPDCFSLDENGLGHFYGHPARSAQLADELLRRLRCDNETRETVVRLVDWHDRPIALTEQGVARALRRLGERDLRRLIQVKRADNLAQAPAYWTRQQELDLGEQLLEQVLAQNACFSLKQLAVNGRDLLALGLRGPAIGETLEALLNRVVDGELPNDREALLKSLQES